MVAAACAAAGGCGHCFFLLGALIEQGDLESSQSASFKVREGGRVEFSWSRTASALPAFGLDRPALAYYVGAELGDPLASIAFARYVSEGLTLGPAEGEWWQADSDQHMAAWRRKPRAAEDTTVELARCRRALKYLSPVAQEAAFNEDHALDATSDLNFLVEKAWEVARAKKEHADWIAAHAHDRHQADEVAYAAYHLHGDSDIGFRQNESKAREMFEKVAVKGNLEAAWSALLLHARAGDLTKLGQNAKLIIEDSSAPKVQKVVAQHYAYRHGFGVQRNATRAGAYLILAADLGDANAQQTVAHGYAGLDCAELDAVKIPGSPNEKRALHYYMLAAKQGRPVSAVNAAALLSQQKGGDSPLQSCQAAVSAFRDVSLAYHPMVLRMHAHARRAFQLGDVGGALLRFQLLSELGARHAHENAAALWSQKGESMESLQPLCWRTPFLDKSRTCEIEYVYRVATFSGKVDAMMRLSAAYAAAQDESEAFHWSSRAASKGNSHALYTAAYHREHGLGTVQDLSGACADYCSLWKRSNDSFLPRAIALARAMRLQWSVAEHCCELPELRPYFFIGGFVGSFLLLLTTITLCLR
jgi:TPR repeat protein